MQCCVFSALLIIICSLTVTQGGLTLEGPQCGQIKCQEGEFCYHVETRCKSCSSICDPTKPRFYEKKTCEEQCQDYLHDQRYGDLKAAVERATIIADVSLALVIILIIILGCIGSFILYKYKQSGKLTIDAVKNKIFGDKCDNNSNKAPPVDHHNGRPDLHLEMPAQSAHTDHSPVTMTTSISRRPAEDSTLDYAYDNPAMVNNSSPTSKTNDSFR